MEVDVFAERLAQIRGRFAAALPSKVDDSFASLPKLSGKDSVAIDTIVVIHRKLHEMCGIAPSLGFPETGKAARAAENVLREPAKFKRSLAAEEIAAFTTELDGLRAAAQSELQSSTDRG